MLLISYQDSVQIKTVGGKSVRLRAPGIIWIDFQIVVAEIILGLTIVKSGYMVTNSSN